MCIFMYVFACVCTYTIGLMLIFVSFLDCSLLYLSKKFNFMYMCVSEWRFGLMSVPWPPWGGQMMVPDPWNW